VTSFIVFLIGVISSQKINLFGEVFIGEILCAAVLLFNIKAIRTPAGSKPLLGLLLVWFIAQLAADIVNQTEFIKAVKGVLAPAFVAMIILGLTTVFYKRYHFLPHYLFGVFIGLWLSRVIGSEYYAHNPWKWGLGSCVALCFFTWIEFYCKRYKSAYLFVGAALFVVVCLANSSRSMAAFMLIASMVAILSSRITLLPIYRRLSASPSGTLQLFFIVLFVVFSIDRSMAALFNFGPFLDLLPPLDAMKYNLQAESKWGVILGGRTELLVSLEAFLDSPIFGHGSWAENSYYTYARLDMMDASGGMLMDLSVAESNIRSFLIPTHSYLMGAMVWGGFFAGLFWLKVIWLSLFGFLNRRVIVSPLLLYIVIGMIWNVLFSPFGADARWLTTILFWFYISMLNDENLKKGSNL
jgi:hypothetical protein